MSWIQKPGSTLPNCMTPTQHANTIRFLSKKLAPSHYFPRMAEK